MSLHPAVGATDRPLLELGAGYGEFRRFIECRGKQALDMNPELVADGRPTSRRSSSPLWKTCPSRTAPRTVFASNFFEHFTLSQGEAILRQVGERFRPAAG